jgi:hypothetical protein
MVDVAHIHQLLRKHFYVNGTVSISSRTGTIDVSGDVSTRSIDGLLLPVQFGDVGGSFDCVSMGLTSLMGAPSSVGGSFNCSYNQLDSLEFAPLVVHGDMSCGLNKLTSLKGAPVTVGGGFYCSRNQLSSLGGAPREVGGSFICVKNPLANIEDMPALIGDQVTISYESHLPLLRLLVAKQIVFQGAVNTSDSSIISVILNKYAGRGRRGAIQAARELLHEGELLQTEKGLSHNPFERNARW